MLKVDVSQWRAEIEKVLDQVVAYLGTDTNADAVQLWVRTASGDVFTTEFLRSEVVPSLTGLFAAADFHEREIAQLLDVQFDRPLQPLYVGVADWLSAAPLQSKIELASRNHQPWPGAKEPGEQNAPGKRRLLPPGVNPNTPPEHLL